MIRSLFIMTILAYGCAGPPPPSVAGIYDFTLAAGAGWNGTMRLHDEGRGSFYGEFFIESRLTLEVGHITGTVQPDGHIDSRWAAVGFMPWNVYGQFAYDGMTGNRNGKIEGTATGSGAHGAKFVAVINKQHSNSYAMTNPPTLPPEWTQEGTGNDGTSWPSAWPDLFTK